MGLLHDYQAVLTAGVTYPTKRSIKYFGFLVVALYGEAVEKTPSLK